LNGVDMGLCVGEPFEVLLEAGSLRRENTLAIDVTGVAANRIRAFDRDGIAWRVFRDINFVSVEYGPFDASGWDIRPVGLLGPVTIRRAR
jgi:hypothetical protein